MAVTVNLYDHIVQKLTDGTIQLTTDTIKVALMTTSHAFNRAHTGWADVSANELAAGNGYTAGGQALASKTWSQTLGVNVFDAADLTWTASGGDIGPAYHAVIYNDTDAGKELIASVDFGGAQTAGSGTDFKITWSASGILVIQPAA